MWIEMCLYLCVYVRVAIPEMNCWKPCVDPNGLPNSLNEKSGLKGIEKPGGTTGSFNIKKQMCKVAKELVFVHFFTSLEIPQNIFLYSIFYHF
jgi:hypothetical protein